MLVRSDGFVRRKKSQHHMAAPAPAPIVKKHLLYEIEKVVDAREGDWGREYFVKWRGYKTRENSWIGELPSFFKKTSHFYIARDGDDGSVVESGCGTDSDEEEAVDSDSDSDEEKAIDFDSDEDEAVETDDEYPVSLPTSRKRKREPKVIVVDSEDDEDEYCKSVHPTARKFILEDDDDDEMNDGVGGVSNATLHGPKTAVVQLKASRDKAKYTRKEQLAMRALLALANYVNDTVSDSD